MDKWLKEKAELMEKDEEYSHTVGERDLVKKEQVSEKKLDKLREKMFTEDPMLINGTHYDKLAKI